MSDGQSDLKSEIAALQLLLGSLQSQLDELPDASRSQLTPVIRQHLTYSVGRLGVLLGPEPPTTAGQHGGGASPMPEWQCADCGRKLSK
jgi:hypothetical protein